MNGMGLALPLDFDADEIALVDCTPASIRGVPQWREVKRVTLRPPGGAGEAAAAGTAVVAATMSALLMRTLQSPTLRSGLPMQPRRAVKRAMQH